MTEKRPNFFRLLRLDPGETNWDKIAKRIEERKRECNRVRPDAAPAQQREAEAFKIYSNEIERVLANTELRRQEAVARRKEIKEEEKQLDGMIRMLRSRGHYLDRDVKSITNQLTEFDERAVEARIKKAKIRKGEPGKKKSQHRARLKISDAEATSIEKDLKGLHLNSLYEFLENKTNKKSSLKHLKAAYDEKKADLGKMIRGQPKHKVWSALLGHVQTHLLVADAKERYDNYLDDRELKTIDNFIKLRAGKSKTLTEDAINEIVREARIPNVTAERTVEYIEDWVNRTSGWTLAVGNEFVGPELLTCGFCGTLAENVEQDNCLDCGKSLKIPCPNEGCNAEVATQHDCCPSCGCSTGDAAFVDDLVKVANKHLGVGSAKALREAESLGRQILDIWAGYRTAVRILDDVKQLRKLREDKVLQEEKRERENLQKLNGLVADRKLFEAERLAEQLKEEGIRIGTATTRQIAKGLATARAQFSEARTLRSQGQHEKAVDHLNAAIEACADFGEARAAVDKFPPPAPTHLRVRVAAEHNRIEWRRATQRSDTKYVVVRKEGGLPAAHSDGIRLAEVTNNRFDDTAVGDGVVYYYAVYALRGSTYSTDRAESKVVLRIGQVDRLRGFAIDGQATITWCLPQGCREVQISRTPGKSISRVAGEEFSERGLELGIAYRYSVVPLYDDPETGSAATIQGRQKSIEIVNFPRPDPVNELVTELAGSQILIKWLPPRVGKVEIRSSSQEPGNDVQPGAYLDVTEARKLGDRLAHVGTDSARMTLPSSGQTHLIPITVEGTCAAVGKWARVTRLPEVVNLRSRPTTPGRIELTWDWPRGIEKVRVTTTSNRRKSVLSTFEIDRAEYQHNGGMCEVAYARAEVCKIKVATKAQQGNFFSTGVCITETLGKESRIRYEVISAKNSWFSQNDAMIVLEKSGDPGLRKLAKLTVVGLPNRLPTNISDGEVVATYEETQFDGNRATLRLPSGKFATDLYLKVFLDRPESHPGVRLVPAPKNRLLLSR